MRRATLATVVVALYTACLVATTWPWATRFDRDLPALSPAVLHDLADFESRYQQSGFGLDGPWPPSLHWPVGMGPGLSPVQALPAFVFTSARSFGVGPVLAYNSTWFAGVLGIGFATFLLARHVHGDLACAAVAGLMVMLSAPVRLRAAGHLDMLNLGVVAIGLLGWLRWVDQPTRGRLALACGGAAVASMAAPVHAAIFALVASLAILLDLARACREGRCDRSYFLRRVLGFVAAALAMVVTITCLQGERIVAIDRAPETNLGASATPFWTYILPATGSRLAPLLEFDPFRAAGIEGMVHEASSYLGVVTIVFLARAVVRRQGLRLESLWWMSLIVLVALSHGLIIAMESMAHLFSWVQIPARFNQGAVLVAAIIASASIRRWLACRTSNARRLVALVAIVGLVVADGSIIPLVPTSPPSEPEARRWAFERQLQEERRPSSTQPAAGILEVPLVDGRDSALAGLQALWSLQRGDRTSAGSTDQPNVEFDRRIGWPCPVTPAQVLDPAFPHDGPVESFDLVRNADFASYLWLYLTECDYTHMVVDARVDGLPPLIAAPDRLRSRLGRAIVHDDGDGFVVATERLARPTVPTAMTTRGWLGRLPLRGNAARRMAESAQLSVYNPDARRAVRLAIEATAYRRARMIEVVADGRVVGEWEVAPRESRLYLSPPFRIAEGIREITLRCGSRAPMDEGPTDAVPATSLIVSALTLQWAEAPASVASVDGSETIR